jgi:hypothetical protein
MKLVVAILSGIVIGSNLTFTHAQNIYKCGGGEVIEYRDAPCATGQEGGTVSSARTVNWQSGANQSLNARLATMPLTASELYIGMTDTQVLNLPRWGRPARVTRTKETHAWRERWTYEYQSTGEDRRLLYFENGILVKQEDASPTPSIEARATIE